jgi:beta-phosphoglucomutase family hydrolase
MALAFTRPYRAQTVLAGRMPGNGPSMSGDPQALKRLPSGVGALLFDVDGVLTDTAKVHARAWKDAFDAVLEELDKGPPFDADHEYQEYVDGRSRLDGVRGFLEERGIDLPEGTPDDSADELTVQGIGRRKNDRLKELIASDGVDAYPGSVEFVRAAHEHVPCAVVSSSANARSALEAAGIADCFKTWVDGERIEAEDIPGKPKPDTFLAAAADLGVEPGDAVVFEDALAGVEAGRAGKFGCVVGVDRHGEADALREHGADLVVSDLSEIEPPA